MAAAEDLLEAQLLKEEEHKRIEVEADDHHEVTSENIVVYQPNQIKFPEKTAEAIKTVTERNNEATQTKLDQEPNMQSTDAVIISAITAVPSYYFDQYSWILQEANAFEETTDSVEIHVQ